MSRKRHRSVVAQKSDNLIQGRRRGNKRVKYDYFRAVSEFLKNAHEDLLSEIFIRLPECRSVLSTGVVCRRWHSVISHPQFIPSFIRQQDCNSYTIIFCKVGWYLRNQPFLVRHSKDSDVLHGKSTIICYLDFMPFDSFFVWASSDDLLLVSRDTCSHRDYYICNPVTKQWVQLPRVVGYDSVGYALVCNSQLESASHQYKVVFLDTPFIYNSFICIGVLTFCFQSGKWSLSTLYYPQPKEFWFNGYLDVVTCNGILYFRENDKFFDRIIALDVFNSNRLDIIDLPDDLVRGWGDSYGKVWIGVVYKALRLCQIFKPHKKCLVMKVWELRSSSWVLVHETNMTRPNTKKLIRLSFLPNNGDVVHMIWGRYIYQYTITKDVYVKIGKHNESLYVHDSTVTDPREHILTIPVLYPPWPTPVPSLPPI